MSDPSQNIRREHYMHRLSYSMRERMVGLFVFLGILLIMITVFASSKTQHFFEERVIIQGSMKTAEGVKRGTVVRISGIDVGEVIDIDIQDDNSIVIQMEILSRFRRLLREDSQAKMGKLSLLGRATIEISAGSPDVPLIPEKTILPIEESKSLDDMIAELTPVLENVLMTIEDISNIVAAIKPERVESTVANFNKVSANMLAISEAIHAESGLLNTLIQDKSFDADIKSSMQSLRKTLIKMPALVDSITQASQRINQALGSNQNNASEHLMLKVKVALDELDKTLKGIQRIWPLSSAIEKNKNHNSLIPAEGAHH